MRAIAGKQMRGLPQGARIDCVDNSGAKIVEIVTVLNYKGVHRRSPAAVTEEDWMMVMEKMELVFEPN